MQSPCCVYCKNGVEMTNPYDAAMVRAGRDVLGDTVMGTKYEWKSVDVITSTAESLKTATEQFVQVAAELQQHGMKEALFPWTQRQWDCLDTIITLANQCVAVLPAQIIAKKQNRPSQYEMMQKKSQRDVAARNARLADGPVMVKKPRGRPKKKTT